MNPEILLQAIYTTLHDAPPAGLDADDVDSFFARNRATLLSVLRQTWAGAAMEPAFACLREDHRLLRLLLDCARNALVRPAAPEVRHAVARFLEAIEDHQGYEANTLFPYLRLRLPALGPALDHAREEHRALVGHVFELGRALRKGVAYDGPAFEALEHHLAEEEEQILGPALAAGLTETPPCPTSPLIHHRYDIEALAGQLASDPPSVAGEPTRWGGRRGRALQPGEIDQNTRIVTEQGEHGLVTEVHAIVVSSLFGGRRDDDVHYSYTLKLDSGRTASPRGQLYEELVWPTAVVPDIQVGERWVAPAEIWSQVTGRHRDISTYAEKADNARKPEMKRQWQRHGATARKEFLELHRLLAAWRWAHPNEPVDGLDERRWRLVTLEARDQLSEDERWELAWLKRVPLDWATRFKVGDRVVIHVLGPHGRQPDPGWTVAEVRDHQAILSRDENLRVRVEPLWMLKPDDSAPVVETFTEPRYLRELAADMLVQEGHHKPYPNRGAVSRAVKSFLAENGIEVSTRVGQGSMVTGIDLRPPSGEWSPDEMARMRELLPGLKVWNADSASFEPWETVGESYDPYADYRGKSAGLLIPVEHLPRFATILAGAMKAEGQALNQLGERRLAAPSSARPSTATRNRGGATADQREQAAEGCRDLDFDLPGYGHIRVVCGQQGRRDQWYNVFHGAQRYGFNGGRWARNLRPAGPILAAIRERGVTIFGG